MKTSSLSALAVLGASVLSLQAEAPRYGVQGLVSIPLSDLKEYVDSKPGPGFGVHGTFDMGDGHMLRPRLDYSLFPEASFATIKQTATSLSLGGDYLYFIAGKPEGLYLTAGLAAVRWSLQQKDVPGIPDSTNNTTKFGIAAGVGYQWSATLGTEARWLHSSLTNKLRDSTQASKFKADTLQVGVTVRF
jgi:opacity protein-like surface antigen